MYAHKSRLTIFASPEGYINTEKMLRVFHNTHIRGTFAGDESRSKLSQREKLIENEVYTSKSTLDRPPIYHRANPEKLKIASQDNAMDVMKPHSLLFSFVQQDEKSLQESTRLKETYVLTI